MGGCRSAGNSGAVTGDVVPISLKASIGGYSGPSYRVELLPDKRIRYSSIVDGEEVVKDVSVSLDEWEGFRFLLERANVFVWKDKYIDRAVKDGTQWAFYIEYGNAKKEVYGSNAYPDYGQFNTFLQAISLIIDNNNFK